MNTIEDLYEYVEKAINITKKVNATKEQLIEELEYMEGTARALKNYDPIFKFLEAYPSLIDACIGVDEFKDFTLLYNSVEFQYYNVVKKLLEMGADPNKVCEYVPLNQAIEDEWIEGVRLLLKYGADPEIDDSFGSTPMEEAREKGNREILNLLKNSECKHRP